MSGWFGKGKQRCILGDAAWDTSAYFAVVIDEADYTYARTHADMTSVPGAARQGTPVALTGKTGTVAGDIDCNPFQITGLEAGQDTAGAVLIYEEAAANDAQRYPLLFINGLTIIPNGGAYDFNPQATSPFLGRF